MLQRVLSQPGLCFSKAHQAEVDLRTIGTIGTNDLYTQRSPGQWCFEIIYTVIVLIHFLN